ncbi:DUF2332 domain-containing protein [Pseudalkalibacillus berkeleyi]|uniref:DUF2332 domain-containing protein n=1 Tax=Pseudalkalibacillus berkeleyi TaxID=1069813 RepID=A0ABS9GXZ6_9BACL|nr:DUF2332 domain-containing protein [Pseudalkalibacillus berkeleyi]MCF6136575.1 DUF2332 domain-containing protein [Pseudalkalibacillus berkeleyi]
MNTAQLSERFKNFASMECSGSSALYEYLSIKISEDDEMLELSSYAQEGQPVPNLILGAVHYLLLKGSNHPLKDYYPSVTDKPKGLEGSFDQLKDFCELHRDEMITILQQRLVQTNEVRRCAYLYPIFCYIYEQVQKPLSMIEIGSSAGLQLLWDKYQYSYGTDEIYGDTQSDVHITSEIKGEHNPSFLKKSPPVVSKVGLDLHISDLGDTDDYLWLKSLIWPEHQERLDLFENAAKRFNEDPVKLIEGDGIALLPEVIDSLPKDTPICIFHTHVANQIPEDSKRALEEKIKAIGQERDVFHLHNNMWDRQLHLDYYLDGKEYTNTIGETDGHGRWFEWNLQKTLV